MDPNPTIAVRVDLGKVPDQILAIDTKVARIDDTVNDPKTGIVQIAHQIGLMPPWASPVPLSDAIADVLRARVAMKFVDELVPLTIWWLFEEPGGQRHERLLRREAPLATKVVQPEQFSPQSLIQLHAIVSVGEKSPWFVFCTMLEMINGGIPVPDGLKNIADYWNEVKAFYGPETESDPIPEDRYLDDAVRRVYVLFGYIHGYLRNIAINVK